MKVPDHRLPLVDALRALAVTCVVALHVAAAQGLLFSPSTLTQYAGRLNVGVWLFFLISGLVIYLPFATAAANGAPRPSTREFALRRIARIGPAYWVALVLIALLSQEWATFEPATLLPLAAFAQNYSSELVVSPLGLGQAWSLSVEAAFYVCVPLYAALLGRLARRHPARRARIEVLGIALLLAASVAFKASALADGSAPRSMWLLPWYVDCFAVGMGLAVLRVHWTTTEKPAPSLLALARVGPLLVLAGLGCFWVAATQLGATGVGVQPLGARTTLGLHGLYVLAALGFLLPVVLEPREPGRLRRRLTARPIILLGTVSYGVFLWHLAVLELVVHLGLLPRSSSGLLLLLNTVWVLAASVVLGLVSWRWVEQPSIAASRRLIARRRARRLLRAAAPPPPPPSAGMAAARHGEGHVASGDGLRGIAAVSVLLFHADVGVVLLLAGRGQPFDFGVLGDVLGRLSAGVYVFFVLSGYLVGGPWVRAWLRGGGYPRPLPYLGRRARRILPAWVVVVLGLLLWHGAAGASTKEVLVLLAFGQVWLRPEGGYVLQQGWTLDLEVMFYLALPLLALAAARLRGPIAPRRRLVLLLAALTLGTVLSALWRHGPADTVEVAGARNLGSFAWAFAPGLVLAALEPTLRPRLGGTGGGRALAAALGVLGLLSVAVLAASPQLREGRLATLLAYAGCGGGLVGGALVWEWATGAAPRGLDSRPLRALGRWSYSLYLVHVGVVLELVRHVPAGSAPSAVLALVVAGTLVGSLALAALVWWLVEQPILTGRRPTLGRPRAPVAEVPTGVPASAVPAAPVRVGTAE